MVRLCIPGCRRNQRRNGAVVVVANSERERNDRLIALRVRIAPCQALAQRATKLVRSDGPRSTLVRDLVCTIYDRFASRQPLPAEFILDVYRTSHVDINSTGSAIVEGIETFDPASIVPDLVETVATIVKVTGDKSAGVAENAAAIAYIAKCVFVVRAVFHAVAVTAKCIQMVSESSRIRTSLQGLHLELVALLHCIFKCIAVFLELRGGN